MIAIAVCTYKRPRYLARLLESFSQMIVPKETVFVIVDNDGDDPGIAELVHAFSEANSKRAEYVVEREPGISAARNTAFRTVRSLGARTMAMLDDAEWPPQLWLQALLLKREETGAKVIGGPVRPVFADVDERMRRHSRFWSVEADNLRGKPFVYCTCNFLIDLDAASFLGDEPFDPAFGISGGGDTVFFRTLFNAGVPMAWSEDAYLHEEIPPGRATVGWLRKRRYRMGNVAYRWEKVAPIVGEMNPAFKTLLAIARLPFYPLASREKSDLLLAWLLESDKLRGRVAAHFGGGYDEYGRGTSGAAPSQAGKTCR